MALLSAYDARTRNCDFQSGMDTHIARGSLNIQRRLTSTISNLVNAIFYINKLEGENLEGGYT